ncbi:hypothetical protein KUTeg_000851 [Tegillarca granosa]|uniref:Uncharacterized protein n=1 Tax=Tegillarca granosa TaxID=220873 RepID=A0ABQ9G305_TEGGR|nr:hypothetical protein KUTeg_000851 [Tegillarca granosa]
MCVDSGIKKKITNHPGNTWTSLYQASIEEKKIMTRTGHRSINVIRQYKRPSKAILKEISNVLEPNVKSKK